PTNGTPCLSSWKPGASPTNIRSASGCPEPNTTCVRPGASAHFVHPATWSANAASERLREPGSSTRDESRGLAGRSPSVAAAAASAAAAAASAKARRLAGAADHRERRQLLRHLRRAAARAFDLHVAADELLEVLLAAHAHELVDRHRLESVDTVSPCGSS